MSRLGEISSDSPKMSARAVAQASGSCFERESISLRRGGLASARECEGYCSPLWSSRLRERSSLVREKPLA
ncbi:hypothetical protein DEO72_LG9g2024 [Vigna unguiculata]|uniref:Uncharacterized protein n=1 Tax=Vigna unguiculata TaxID=3917 RepID=A0A4D6N3D2_VIGUN|nr:hypothetical protein DEO72_LG9g2024 [Vigna unguiculata]